MSLAGVAAGPDLEFAERAALEEIAERDATMIAWHGDADLVGVDLDEEAATLLEPRVPSSIRYHVVVLPTVLGVPVLGVLLDDPERQIVTLGVACRGRARDALAKALAEAVSLHVYAEGLLEPDGDVWRAVEAGMLDASFLKPWRADRRYADSYAADFRDVTDLSAQSQIYLDPRMRVHLHRLIDPPERVAIDDLPEVADTRTHLLDRLHRLDMDPVTVDLTTRDLGLAGLRVARVVAPGTVGNAPAAFPLLGTDRYRTEPAALGAAPRPRRRDELVRAPIPHT